MVSVARASEVIKASPKEARRKDDDGRLPVHWAASSNCYDIAMMLAQLKDFDPDVQDDSGWSPLMIAASVQDSEETLSLLLAKGANVNQKSTCPERPGRHQLTTASTMQTSVARQVVKLLASIYVATRAGR
jgi:ankyrin repeat protein